MRALGARRFIGASATFYVIGLSLFFSLFILLQIGDSSAAVLKQKGDADKKKPDPFEKLFAVDIDANNFNHWLTTSETVPGGAPKSQYAEDDTYFMVDFYAPWCPHCKAFSPDYERVCQIFNDHDTPIWGGRINCVKEGALCRQFGIESYPTVKFGKRSAFAKFLAQKEEKEPSYFKVSNILTTKKNADMTVEWINNKIKTKYQLADEATYLAAKERVQIYHNGGVPLSKEPPVVKKPLAKPGFSLPPKVETPAERLAREKAAKEVLARERQLRRERLGIGAKSDLWDVEKATVTVLQMTLNAYVATSKEHDVQKRGFLADFIDLLAHHFPLITCRASIADFGRWLHTSWPIGGEPPNAEQLEKNLRLCGKPFSHYETRDWRACKGSSPEFRGYTCGLWMLFHNLVAQIPLLPAHEHAPATVDDFLVPGIPLRSGPQTPAQDAWRIRTFLENFFMCEDCRQHFLGMSVNMTQEIKSKRDAVIWFWNAHNTVNKRLVEQGSVTGNDPQFPKVQWPSYDHCQRCRTSPPDEAERAALYLPVPLEKQIIPPAQPVKTDILNEAGEKIGERVLPVVWDYEQVYQFLMWHYHGRSRYQDLPMMLWDKETPAERITRMEADWKEKADYEKQLKIWQAKDSEYTTNKQRNEQEERLRQEAEENERRAQEERERADQEREDRERQEQEDRERADRERKEQEARENEEKKAREREEQEARDREEQETRQREEAARKQKEQKALEEERQRREKEEKDKKEKDERKQREDREKEERTQREKEAKEKEAREKEAREKEAREKEARENEAREEERAQREKETKEKIERDLQEKEDKLILERSRAAEIADQQAQQLKQHHQQLQELQQLLQQQQQQYASRGISGNGLWIWLIVAVFAVLVVAYFSRRSATRKSKSPKEAGVAALREGSPKLAGVGSGSAEAGLTNGKAGSKTDKTDKTTPKTGNGSVAARHRNVV